MAERRFIIARDVTEIPRDDESKSRFATGWQPPEPPRLTRKTED